jgi:histidinol-phosphate aminotransferase
MNKEMNIEALVRPNILALRPYSSARSEFSGSAAVLLDANESAYGAPCGYSHADNLQRYPDPLQKELRGLLAEQLGLSREQVFIGNGSDEAIDLLVRIFCRPGQDSILITPPTYGMYEVAAGIHDLQIIRVPLTASFALDAAPMRAALTQNPKLTFLCSPNNPTANLLDRSLMLQIVKESASIVVVDEAYIDFAEGESVLSTLQDCPNLVVLRTFSKARGLAGLRVGIALASPQIIRLMDKVKAPYNLNSLSQRLACNALQRKDWLARSVALVKEQRALLIAELNKLESVQQVYPSDANFLLVKFKSPAEAMKSLQAAGVIVRDRSTTPGCEYCLRISVGSVAENQQLLRALRGESLENATQLRRASVSRVTKETEIRVEVSLDGSGQAQICTGLGFFDHMLEQIARHSGVDLSIQVRGDLQVDEHHSVEDCAIALGEALRQALGDKAGIARYAFALPMDEADAHVLLDLSGRSFLRWEASFSRERVGDLPTELFSHFFRSLSDALKATLHVRAQGENEHHKIEAIFKAFARCLRQAVQIEDASGALPSTKGQL